MHLIPRMATALVFFIYIGEEGLKAQVVTRLYTPKQLCGAALSDELQLVCEGKYNNIIKKGAGPVQALTNLIACFSLITAKLKKSASWLKGGKYIAKQDLIDNSTATTITTYTNLHCCYFILLHSILHIFLLLYI